MSIHEEFSLKIIHNPEWEKIRGELCKVTYDPKLSNLWGKLCWHVNNGPGYCEEAPEEVKVLLRRLGVEV